MANIYDLTDTWNAGGTTFSAIKMDVTDTASAAASLLLDLRVAGSGKAAIRKDGAAFFSGSVSVGAVGFSTGTPALKQWGATTGLAIARNDGGGAGTGLDLGLRNLCASSTGTIGFNSTTSPDANAIDAGIYRDAAAVVGVRGSSSTTAAAMSLYTHGASPPAAPAASIVRFYADTSGGKIRLMALFPTGAAQQVAIEP